jgi:hypothetical protein
MHVASAARPFADPGDVLSLMGSLYACLSVILVFQMFALQSWYSEAVELDRFSYEVDEKWMRDSLERKQALVRLAGHKKHYPGIQVVGLSSVTLVICVFAILLGTEVHTISYVFTVGPGVVLAVTSLGMTVAITLRGMSTLKTAAGRLK